MKTVKAKIEKLNSLDKYVIFSITLLLIFTIAEFVVSTITGVSHDSLIVAFFGFFGAPEIVVCGLIKIFKLRNGDGQE